MTRKNKSARHETRPDALRSAILNRVIRLTTASGKMTLPAIPSLVDHYADRIATLFRALGRPSSPAEVGTLRRILAERIADAFDASQYGHVLVTYETDPMPAMSLRYTITTVKLSLAERFDDWMANRTPPFFGSTADAKLLALAVMLGPPGEARVLDVGAGTGRNTLALARLGFPVDALEMTPSFCATLRETSGAEGLAVKVLEQNFLDPAMRLERRYRLVLLSEVVSDFRIHESNLRRLFERASEGLLPGGYLLFNCFVPCEGHVPSQLEREMSEVAWASVFSERDLSKAAEGQHFALVSSEPVHDFEKAHLPQGEWPPIWWYPDWVGGRDIYDLSQGRCPIEMRWLVYRRVDA